MQPNRSFIRLTIATLIIASLVACGSDAPKPPGNSEPFGSASDGGANEGGNPTPSGSAGGLSPANYAADCSSAPDCVAVYLGNDPCCGNCATHAIAKRDKAKYDADLATFRATCGRGFGAGCPDVSCLAVQLGCTEGRCSLGR